MTVPADEATGADGAPGSDPYDVRLALGATGLLREFNQAGVLVAADVHVAQRLARLGGESDQQVLLAAALAVRAVRLGSVCVVLAQAGATVSADDDSRVGVAELAWPGPDQWVAACAASPLVAVDAEENPPGGPGRPLRLVDGLLYLDRYWREEQLVRAELDERVARPVEGVDGGALRAALAELFPGDGPDRQRLAAAMTALRSVTVLAGGPGTGKTTTVARLLAMLRRLPGGPPRVALAAPTGKAAARLQEAIEEAVSRGRLDAGDAHASTLHRLLGRRPGSRSRFRHDSGNRLPYDVVIVDESSMVSLTLMARLLEAVRPEARLVLVGDPDQLASVEAGAVLGDLVERPAVRGGEVPAQLAEVAGRDLADVGSESPGLRNGVVRLTVPHRYAGRIDDLARAVQVGDPDTVLHVLHSDDPTVEFVQADTTGLRGDVTTASAELLDAARRGDVDSALSVLHRHQLLCAHRRGPHGVGRWTREVERWLSASIEGYAAEGEWYVGRPLLVTANDYEVQLYNGDTGVVVDHGARGVTAAFARGREPLLLSPNRLSAVQTVHAMTVHRAQGSQFERVSLLLPPEDSPLLTRELFYTGVTRAQQKVRVIGSEAAVRLAVARPIVRASGLRRQGA